MKPDLVIGLGNPLMGDDGAGWHAAEELALDPRLPADTEVFCGGTDLLRCGDRMAGRRRVILVDAVLDHAAPGTMSVDAPQELDQDQAHAHHLSAAQALRLLRLASPALQGTQFTLVSVSITSASVGPALSAALAQRLPEIVDRVLDLLRPAP